MSAPGNPRAVAIAGLLSALLVLALAGTATALSDDLCPSDRPAEPGCTAAPAASRLATPTPSTPTPRTPQTAAGARPTPATVVPPNVVGPER